MRLYSIIKRPILTEKSSTAELKNSTYLFEVSDDATKIDIKKAILHIYWLEVSRVNILKTREKFKQWRKWIVYKRRPSKRAYVMLKNKNEKLDFTVLKK